MAHDAPANDGKPTRLVIRNIGLLLTGALEKPILTPTPSLRWTATSRRSAESRTSTREGDDHRRQWGSAVARG